MRIIVPVNADGTNDLNFKPQQINNRGKKAWRIYIGKKDNGQRQYLRWSGKDAEQKALKKQKELLSKQNRNDTLALKAVAVANDHVVAGAMAKLAVVGATLEEAVEYYLDNNFAKRGKCSVEDAMQDFMADAIKGKIKATTMEEYQRRTNIIAKYFGAKNVNDVTTDDLEEMFDKVGSCWGVETQRHARRFTITIWNFLGRKRYISQKTDHAAKDLKIPLPADYTPKRSNFKEVFHLLYWTDARARKVGGYKKPNLYDCVARYVFVLFLGIRKSEAVQILWSDINLVDRNITVRAEVSKTGKPRTNYLIDNAYQWLLYLKGKAPLDVSGDPERRIYNLQKIYRTELLKQSKKIPDIVATEDKMESSGNIKAKEKFHNIMRHTFAGHYLRLKESVSKTALMMGNKEEKVRSNYWELVKTEREAQQYFKILPPVLVEIKEVDTSGLDEEETKNVLLERAVEAHNLQQLLNPFVEHHRELWDNFQKIIDEYTEHSHSKQQDVWKQSEWENSEHFNRTESGIEYIMEPLDPL